MRPLLVRQCYYCKRMRLEESKRWEMNKDMLSTKIQTLAHFLLTPNNDCYSRRPSQGSPNSNSNERISIRSNSHRACFGRQLVLTLHLHDRLPIDKKATTHRPSQHANENRETPEPDCSPKPKPRIERIPRVHKVEDKKKYNGQYVLSHKKFVS